MVERLLEFTAGEPLLKQIKVPNIVSIWPDVSDIEVRAQLRRGEFRTSPLIENLHTFMTWEYDGDDLIISWTMTGEQTRALYQKKWDNFKKGYFNIIISDVGTDDEKALVVPLLTLQGLDTTTKEEGIL